MIPNFEEDLLDVFVDAVIAVTSTLIMYLITRG
jgi:hypothetical protein